MDQRGQELYESIDELQISVISWLHSNSGRSND